MPHQLALENSNLTQIQKLIVLYGVAARLCHMHASGYVHCDVKPQNILLDANFWPQIIDFDISFRLGTEWHADMNRGTARYEAPELSIADSSAILANSRRAADVYGFGVLMYCVLAGTDFGDGWSPDDTRDAVCGGWRPELSSSMLLPYRRLITDCWRGCWARRPFMKSVVARLAAAALADDSVDPKEFRNYLVATDECRNFPVPTEWNDAHWIGWVFGFLLFLVNFLFFMLNPQ
jgi:serine/threonine protein kinase